MKTVGMTEFRTEPHQNNFTIPERYIKKKKERKLARYLSET
jgi:hypothetical protein